MKLDCGGWQSRWFSPQCWSQLRTQSRLSWLRASGSGIGTLRSGVPEGQFHPRLGMVGRGLHTCRRIAGHHGLVKTGIIVHIAHCQGRLSIALGRSGLGVGSILLQCIGRPKEKHDGVFLHDPLLHRLGRQPAVVGPPLIRCGDVEYDFHGPVVGAALIFASVVHELDEICAQQTRVIGGISKAPRRTVVPL
jgi:hypothetical protein